MSPRPPPRRILVIKHGALGDVVQATGAFQAIRRHHPDAHIVLLTTPPYADFARASGCFDAVWTDRRAPPWRLDEVWRLLRMLRRGAFDRVYDLQTSSRSSFYLRLFPRRGRPEWSGIAAGASHRHASPDRKLLHTRERQAAQLRIAGIAEVPPPDLGFLRSDLARFRLEGPFALLVPGGSAHRPEKRWPVESYAALAGMLQRRSLQPVLVGGAPERTEMDRLAAAVPESLNLCGATSFADLAELARAARVAVGNDTGPMHLVAAAGCPSLVLFSGASDPARSAPRGRVVRVLQREPLSSLGPDAVLAALPA